MLRIRPPLWAFAAPTLLAGRPAVLGMGAGSLASAPQLSALALNVGAVPFLQLVFEVTAYLMWQNRHQQAALFSTAKLDRFLRVARSSMPPQR